jgi:hypothetical protein
MDAWCAQDLGDPRSRISGPGLPVLFRQYYCLIFSVFTTLHPYSPPL